MSYPAAGFIPFIFLFIIGIYDNLELVKTISLVTTEGSIYSGILLFLGSLVSFKLLPGFISLPLAIGLIWHDLGQTLSLLVFFKVCFILGINITSAFLLIRPYFSVTRASLIILATIWLIIIKVFLLSLLGMFNISSDLCLSAAIILFSLLRLRLLNISFGHLRPRIGCGDPWDFSFLLTLSICFFYLVYNLNLSGDAVKIYFFFPYLVADSGQLAHPFMGESMYQYLPKAFELLLAQGMLYGGVLGGKTIQFLIIIGFILAFKEFCSQKLSLGKYWPNILITLLFCISQFFTYMDRSSPDLLLLLVNMLLLNFANTRSLALLGSVFILGMTTKYTFVYVIFAFIILRSYELFSLEQRSIKTLIKSFRLSHFSITILSLLATVPAYFYIEAYINTGSVFQNISKANVSTLFPSPYKSWFDGFSFLTHAYIDTSKYSEVYPFAYGVLGFFLIPSLFLVNFRNMALNIPLIFFALQLNFTSQTRYLYSVIPLMFLNSTTALTKIRNGPLVAAVTIFLALISTMAWPKNIRYNPNILSFLGFRHTAVAEGDYSRVPFQIEVNRILTLPSRSFVSHWDYNLHTHTVPYKEVITSVFRLREVINQQNLGNTRLFMIWFPIESESLLGANSFIARCISRNISLIPFDFMPGEDLTIYEIDVGKLDGLVQTLASAGFSQRDNWLNYDKQIRDDLIKNFDERACQSEAIMRSLFLKR